MPSADASNNMVRARSKIKPDPLTFQYPSFLLVTAQYTQIT